MTNWKRSLGWSLVVALAVAVGVGLGGCGGDSDAAQRTELCDTTDGVDEALLPPIPSVCSTDTECPCGMHCDLGECVSACSGNSECSDGMECDDFGRCRTAEMKNRVGTTIADSAGTLDVSRTELSISNHDRQRSLQLRIVDGDIERVRVDSRDDLEVACGDEQFGDECRLSSLQQGDETRLRIRATDNTDFSSTDRREVRVFTPQQRETIGVRISGGSREVDTESGIAGIYEGYAWPEGSGFVTRTRLNEFTDQIRNMRIPITIVVYPGDDDQSRIATLEDGLGLLFPNGETVGQFEDSGDVWQLSTPREIYSDAQARPHIEEPILVDGDNQSVDWQGANLEIERRSQFQGLIPDERAPYVDWQISTSRVYEFSDEELEELDVPEVPDDHPLVDTMDQIAEPMAFESMVGDYFGWNSSDFDEHYEYVAALLCTEYPNTAGGWGDGPYGLTRNIYQTIPGANHPAGELACEGSDGAVPPMAFELLNDAVLDVEQNLETCFSDFERAENARVTGVLNPEPADCVDEARFVKALTAAQYADRNRALNVDNASDDKSSALAHRLVQQWMSLHTFLGREFSKVETFNAVVPADQAVDLQSNRLEVIDRITRGFDLLLTPRIASAIAYFSSSQLHNDTDYREVLFRDEEFPPQRTHDQNIGLPVAMLQAYAEQLSAIGDFLEDVQYARSDIDDIEEPTKDAIRQGMLLMAIAQGMYDEGLDVGGTPEWEHEWQLTRQQVGARITGVMNQLEDARNMVNPLGISDVDLPLYRIGDQQQTIQRFSAVSDFLVGTSPSDPAVATSQVAQAHDALDLAREAWLENVQRDLSEQLLEDEQERRINSIRRNYGSQVNGLCGGTGYDNIEVLEHADEINGSTCFIANQCREDIDDYSQYFSSSDVGYDLCMTSQLRDRLGTSITSGNQQIDEALDNLGPIYAGAEGGIATRYGETLPSGRVQIAVEDSGGERLETVEFDPDNFSPGSGQIPENISDELLEDIQQTCERHRQYSEEQRPETIPDSCDNTDQCPVNYRCDDGACTYRDEDHQVDPDCYTGALGEMALEVRSLSTAVDGARAKIQEHSERYDNAMRSCMIIAEGNELMAEQQESHNTTMNLLDGLKFAADGAAHLATAGRHSASVDAGLTGGVTAGFAVAEAAAKIISDGFALSMRIVERQHEETMAALEAAVEEETCYNDAEMHLIGVQSASIDLQRATEDLSAQIVAFENQKGSVNGLLQEGQLELQNEIERTRAPLDIDFWLDDRINSLERYMRAARRATYLAVMAVEYEYQFSSAERHAALAAEIPADFERILDNLRAFTMAGNVGGSNPGELLAVVSLRDHILQLGDNSDVPPGFYEMSSADRFEALLNSSEFAVYEDGQYQGQEIPFQLAPMGQQALGSHQGISLLAGTDCAERLWSANMSLHGEDLYQGDDPSFTRVVLRKRNTFYSQWCSADMGGANGEHQLASTRPSRNLFIDPYARDESTTPVTAGFDGGGDEVDAFSNARISAYFNTPRQELETEDYSQGQTAELAGRGLYGDYAIFFPAETLSRNGSNGLTLENLEDILLRIDYVSVSQ